jgi:tRNA pseudouridine38-40 synthase
MDKQRWAMGVAYEGTQYSGWQIQKDCDQTVQAFVEKALSFVANEPIAVVCAGRTDAGVHASGQVIHFDCSAKRDAHSFILGANSVLPKDISITWALPVSLNFHARFGASSRRYSYFIYNHRSRPGILSSLVTWQCRPLDEHRMQEAANSLIGEHDFSAFRGAGCQASSPVRTVQYCSMKRFHDMIILEIQANAFLMHMVRNIVGSLSLVGMGMQPVSWFSNVLQQKDRQLAGPTAPPNGLYLADVSYPEFDLPQNTAGPFCWPSLKGFENR